MNHPVTDISAVAEALTSGSWHLDPPRSRIAFSVRFLWGLTAVKGQLDGFETRLDVSCNAMVTMTAAVSGLDTKNRWRDRRLQADDFFAAEAHPLIEFMSDAVVITEDLVMIDGRLSAAGRSVMVSTVGEIWNNGIEDEYEVKLFAEVDQRELGMSWSPWKTLRGPAQITIRGTLMRDRPRRRARFPRGRRAPEHGTPGRARQLV